MSPVTTDSYQCFQNWLKLWAKRSSDHIQYYAVFQSRTEWIWISGTENGGIYNVSIGTLWPDQGVIGIKWMLMAKMVSDWNQTGMVLSSVIRVHD